MEPGEWDGSDGPCLRNYLSTSRVMNSMILETLYLHVLFLAISLSCRVSKPTPSFIDVWVFRSSEQSPCVRVLGREASALPETA